MSYQAQFTLQHDGQLILSHVVGGWDLMTARDYCASFNQTTIRLYHWPFDKMNPASSL